MPNEPQTTLSDATLPDHLAATVWELNGLPAERMAPWLADVLAGRKVLPVGMPGDGVADALVDLEPCLEDLPRRAFHDAVRRSVQQCVERNEPDSLRVLLHVAVQRDYRSVGRDLARLVTRTPQDFDALPPDSRCRILSAIRDLHVALAPEFWEALAQRDAGLFGGIVFAALAATDPARAISLLPQLPPNSDALTDVFEIHLPLAWNAANPTHRERMRQALAAVVPQCPGATRDALNQFADDLGYRRVPRGGYLDTGAPEHRQRFEAVPPPDRGSANASRPGSLTSLKARRSPHGVNPQESSGQADLAGPGIVAGG